MLNKEEIREKIKSGEKIDWVYISRYQKLSEEFIKEFSDKVDWHNISFYQKLSEGFIREFSDEVNWDLITCYQELSEGFILEFYDRVNWDVLEKNKKIKKELLEGMNRERRLYMVMNYREIWGRYVK